MNNSAEKRQGQLLELLGHKTQLSVKELAEQINVSVTTIRKDLSYLEQQRYITVTKGVVTINSALPIAKELVVNPKGKRRIAKEAASLVKDGSHIFLSAGSTCIFLVEELIQRDIPFTLLTDSLYLCSIIGERSKVQVYVSGGRYTRNSSSVRLPSVVTLPDFHIDLSFIEFAGYQTSKGFITLYSEEEELFKRLPPRTTTTVALISSSSTLPANPSMAVAPRLVSMVITDKRPTEFIQADLREQRVDLITV